ncbi:jg20240 [Pararge aegeria aegeria]|uniref:Jg20240 protein n=1 Tax=Pararge aegeria aegeria TaxID=348720 RepID=A0A8S4R3X5_9NEOP|nr:jg20240 [Pararge aegeria aegeria]
MVGARRETCACAAPLSRGDILNENGVFSRRTKTVATGVRRPLVIGGPWIQFSLDMSKFSHLYKLQVNQQKE